MTSLSTVDDNDSTAPQIGALLRAAHEIVYDTVYARTAEAGYLKLHPAHFRLLQFPGIDGVRPTELARSLVTSKQAITPLLNDLEQWGYIRREPDHRDGRGRVIRLTNRGHELMRTIRAIHQQIESAWATQLGARVFHLGGGVGAQQDSVFRYKAGFSDRRHTFRTWRWILRPDIYEQCCARATEKNVNNGLRAASDGYFPAYRGPTISAVPGESEVFTAAVEKEDCLHA